ncbi:sensor histidine kinase [Undibacterium griseum]|nr:histidine kinase [Undibacterium griseum]
MTDSTISALQTSEHDQPLPTEVAAKSEFWLTRARNYPVFSRTWYRYRAIAWLGTLVPVMLYLLSVPLVRGSDWRPMFISWVPLAIAGTSFHLVGPALAVWVRQRAYPEKKEWRGLVLAIVTGMIFSLGIFSLSRELTQNMLHHHVPVLTALKMNSRGISIEKQADVIAEEKQTHVISDAFRDFWKGFQDGYHGHSSGMPETAIPDDFWQGFYIGLLISGLSIFIGGGYDLWLFSRQRNMLKAANSQREAERAKAIQREAELRLSVLVAQVEPHFLFNTLAGVRSAIATEPERAVSIVDHLVDYLRATIPQLRDDGSSVQARLKKQLDAARSYLSLMQARIPRLSFSVESDLDDAAVPPLMLISLVENAVKHGVEPKVGAAHIRITARRSVEQGAPVLELRVEDDGVGFGGSSSGSGIGLANIHERLASMYGNRAALVLKARPAGGVAAIITLPLEA